MTNNTRNKEVKKSKKKKKKKKEKQLSGFKAWRLNTALKFQRARDQVKDFFLWFEIWRASLKEVEGQFGTAVVSFFVFVKWMLYLNIAIFLVILSFVIIPQAIINKSETLNSNDTCSVLYEQFVQHETETDAGNVFKYVVDFLEGNGFMEYTVLFYGFYTPSVNYSDISYDMSMAYLLIGFACFLLSVIVVARRAGDGFKQNMLDREGHQCKYSQLVFTGWDFSLTDSKNASLKHKSILFEITGDLGEEQRKIQQASMSTKEKAVLYTIRIVINVVCVATGVGALIGIVYVTLYAIEKSSDSGMSGIVEFLISYLPSITVTVINSIVPIVFGILVKFEKYSPNFEINITLGRTVLLRLASLAVLIGSIIPRITNCDNNKNNISYVIQYCDACEEDTQCWETYLGQEMYKLCITDFAAVIGVILFYEFPRRLITRYFECGITKILGDMEFEIPKNVLAIVYSQAICWLGAFFCPLIPFMTAVKFIIVFYLKKWSLLYNMVPSARPYKASRSGFFFMVILLVTYLLCFAPVICAMTLMQPSRGCGPFRYLPTMWETIVISFEEWPDFIQNIVKYALSSGFLVPLIILILSLIMYYYYVAGGAQKEVISQLKEQLVMEGRDKHFLLQEMQKLQPSVKQELRQKRMTSGSTPGTLRGKRQSVQQRQPVYETKFFNDDDVIGYAMDDVSSVSSIVEIAGPSGDVGLYNSDDEDRYSR
ncbi:transmembrane channel-like protein 7 isoform X2 [Antedon mediterranea]|uniref:transmembrane channel-like protein 7 isoform X2 n=1 Tax=Antedon mediterranea TaxID=105859 RepID=UPI003AF66B81